MFLPTARAFGIVGDDDTNAWPLVTDINMHFDGQRLVYGGISTLLDQ